MKSVPPRSDKPSHDEAKKKGGTGISSPRPRKSAAFLRLHLLLEGAAPSIGKDSPESSENWPSLAFHSLKASRS